MKKKKTMIILSPIQAERDDIKHLVLQNRMASDLILAVQGGGVQGWIFGMLYLYTM